MRSKRKGQQQAARDTKHYESVKTGAYFITFGTMKGECMLGVVEDGQMRLNQFGSVVSEQWQKISEYFHNVKLDVFGIMPNHVHGILFITKIVLDDCRGEITSPLHKLTLGKIAAHFKYGSTRQINKLRGSTGVQLWQRNYREQIIKNDAELNTIRGYIISNPLRWDLDHANPLNRGK